MNASVLSVAGGPAALAAALSDPRAAAAQGQLEAYNAQDIDAFMAFYAEDCVIADLNGAASSRGAAQIREKHVNLFKTFPNNKVELVNRVIVGATVIDHERVRREPDSEPFEVAAIYTIRDGLIVRVDFVR